MAVSDIKPELPKVGVPALERKTQGANITEIKIALLAQAADIELLKNGSLGTGDMTKALYDPQLVQADAFSRPNHTGVMPLSGLASGTANRLVGYDAAGAPTEITAGANVSISAGVISATGGGDPGSGDMDAAVYDPQSIVGDAFARANHTGTQGLDALNATGTRDSTTFLRGDNTFAVPPGSGTGAVDSVFGRTAEVAAQAGDYGANQITFSPAGNLAGTDVQAVCEELDTEKFDATDGSLASALTAITLAEIDPAVDLLLVWDNSAGALKKLAWSQQTEEIVISASDETTDLTTGTAKTTFRMPFAMTLTAVRASVNTAPTGATLTVDINEGGTSILSTKLTIDAGEKTSTTAAAAAVISDSALADDAEITIDIDQIGSTAAGKGLKVTLIGTRP